MRNILPGSLSESDLRRYDLDIVAHWQMITAQRNKDSVPLKMRPLAFDAPSEWEFVRELEAFYNSGPGSLSGMISSWRTVAANI